MSNWTTFENPFKKSKKHVLQHFNLDELNSAETSSIGTESYLSNLEDHAFTRLDELRSNESSLACLVDDLPANEKHFDEINAQDEKYFDERNAHDGEYAFSLEENNIGRICLDERNATNKKEEEMKCIINESSSGADVRSNPLIENIRSSNSQAFVPHKEKTFSEQQLKMLDREDEVAFKNDEITITKKNKKNEEREVQQIRELELLRINTSQQNSYELMDNNAGGRGENEFLEDNSRDEIENCIRLDQYNKVSPFDEVPGFKRTFSTNKNSKEKSMITNKLTKSNSLDVERFDRSPAVRRGHWIQFEESNMKSSTVPRNMSRTYKEQSLSTTLPTPSKKNWISFTDDNTEGTSLIDESKFDTSELGSGDEEMKDKERIASLDNALKMAVNKTVTLLKHSISKQPNQKEEEKVFLKTDNDDDDCASEIFDEIVSLEYDSEDDNKKLQDTPLKQFPDVLLFQATSALKKEQLKLALNNTTPNVHVPVIEERKKVLDEYPLKCIRTSWNFWYRYPDRKKKVSSRSWLPVCVKLEGDYVKLNISAKNKNDIVKEIPLHPFFVFTVPKLHTGNKDGKVHSVKLQYVKYKEIRRFKRHLVIEHRPIYTPVLKLATRDLIALREFIGCVETVIRHIPTYRDKGITYRHEEIFIDCDDNAQFLLDGNGEVLMYNATVQMRLRVFITGNPELKLFLNDISCKEISSKTKEQLFTESKPPLHWIEPEDFEYHPCVDTEASKQKGGIVFVPPDGCSFELLRFRVHRKNGLPLIAKSSLEVLSGNSVRLQASVQVSGSKKSIRFKRNDVLVYFPIPSSWSTLFVTSRSINGTKKYIQTKASPTKSTSNTAILKRVSLEISTGAARYEPAFGAIVWRVGTLPKMQGGQPADFVHTFRCFLELPFALEIRDNFQPFSYVEFNIAHQSISDVSIEEVLLSDGKTPGKWVCYRSNYIYKMSMSLLENGKERISPR